MFCPTCGGDSQKPNAYCKRCGEWLPEIKGGTRRGFGGETPQQNIFTGLFMSALSALAALVSAVALYATYLGSGTARWSVYLAAAVCLCIAGWQASSFAVGLKLSRRLRRARDEPVSPSELGTVRSAPALAAADMTEFVSAPTVTEDTTAQLEMARAPKRDTHR